MGKIHPTQKISQLFFKVEPRVTLSCWSSRAYSNLRAEIGNAISAMFKRERITLVQALEMLNDFEQLSFETVDFDLRRAIQISHEYKIYAYDAYVLECANRLNLPLVTLDKLMQEKAKQLNIILIEV